MPLISRKKLQRQLYVEKGDYVAVLKGNHFLFYKEVQKYFSGETLEGLEKTPRH